MFRIKTWLLNCLYLAVYGVVLPVILYRRIFRRRPLGNFRERFLGMVPVVDRHRHCIWLHAVSVGEVNLLATLLDKLRQQYPHSRFVISTTTATGRKLARDKYPDMTSFYCPIDFSWAMGNALTRITPDLIVLAELELWPNLIHLASKRTIPVVVVNGRLSEKSFRGYQRIRRLLASTFGRLERVAVQTREYAERFVQLGCDPQRVSVVGSIKFDGAFSPVDNGLVQQLKATVCPADDDILLVAGSTQDPEELMVARIWSNLKDDFPNLRLVIVPRHPHRGAGIQRQLTRAGVESQLRSLDLHASLSRQQVLIADTIGELAVWWSLASIAFVGGSFGDRGGQNMIEPAACGAAVCFGPNTWNFRQVVELMCSNKVATEVRTESELYQFIQLCLVDSTFTSNQGQAARRLVRSKQGAVDRTCDLITDCVDRQSAEVAAERKVA